jgi:hypothetical protein
VVGTAGGHLQLWFERHLVYDVFGHYDQVTVVRANAQGDRLFSACAVGKLVLWAVSRGPPPYKLSSLGSMDMLSFGSFDPVVQSIDVRVVPHPPPPKEQDRRPPPKVAGGRLSPPPSPENGDPGGGRGASAGAVDVMSRLGSSSGGGGGGGGRSARPDYADLVLLVGTAGGEVFEISATTELDVNGRPLVSTHRGEDLVGLCVTRGRLCVTGGDDGLLRFVDLDGRQVTRSVSLGDVISCVAVSPTLPLVVAGVGERTNPRPGGKEGVFYVVSMEDMSCKWLGRDSTACLTAVQFVPTVKAGGGGGGVQQFAVASMDGCVYVYFLEYREAQRDYKVWLRDKVDFGQGPCAALDFSADGRFLQCEVRAHEGLAARGRLRYLDFTQKHLAAKGEDNAVWGEHVDMQTQWASWTCKCGWAVAGVAARTSDLTAVARSPGGELFATTDVFGRLVLVRAPSLTQRPARVVGYAHGSRAANVAFTADGRTVLTLGGNDRCLVQWRLQLDRVDADVVSAVQRCEVLRGEIAQQNQKLRAVRAALKLSLKPLIEERQFVQAKVNSWRQRVKRTMEPLQKCVGCSLLFKVLFDGAV